MVVGPYLLKLIFSQTVFYQHIASSLKPECCQLCEGLHVCLYMLKSQPSTGAERSPKRLLSAGMGPHNILVTAPCRSDPLVKFMLGVLSLVSGGKIDIYWALFQPIVHLPIFAG